jgi:membrane fusion protein (multidrug efflux system)
MATRITEPEAESSATQPQAGVSQRPAPAAGELRAEDKPSLISQPRARGFIFASVIVLLVLGVLVFWYYHGRESTDDAEVDGHLAPISSKVSGNVLQVLVDDNQLVKAGQVLVKLDPRDYQEAVEQATASLALAKAHAQSANAGVPLQQETTQTGESSASANLDAAFAQQSGAEISYQKSMTSDLAYAKAQVSKQQAAFDKAHNDVVRMRPLAEKAEISAQEFDGYVTTERQAESELESARQKLAEAEQDSNSSKASLDAAHSKVTAARAQVAQSKANEKQVVERVADAAAAKASIAQAQANLDAANLNLSYTTVVAPVDGVVTRKTVEVGQVLQPGQGLLVVVPLKDVWVTANFKETQLKHVVPGQKAEIHVDMYGETFTGHVDSIAGATGSRLSLLPPENATGNFVKVVQRIPVKIVLDPVPPDKAILRPGMNVDATILTR